MKILFISHDAFRAGAQILLLNLAGILKSEHDIDFLLKEGGVLESRFRAMGNTYFVKKEGPIQRSRIFRTISKRIPQKERALNMEGVDFEKYDLILSNTITNGDVLPAIRERFNKPIISYIHELEMAARYFTDEEKVKQVIRCSDFFLVPSNAVRDFLMNSFQIDEDKIRILPYYIPPSDLKEFNKPAMEKTELVVGGAGTTDWRKGIDIFLQVAYRVKELNPQLPVRFLWKGAQKGAEYQKLLYDVKKSNLIETVEILMADENMDSFFSRIDVFLLTSREDPFPLVVLEAANFGVPSIVFDGSGGAKEFVENDSGIVVPYFSVNEVAHSVITYYNDRNLLKSHGLNAKNQLKKEYQNPKKIIGIFNNILNEIINKK